MRTIFFFGLHRLSQVQCAFLLCRGIPECPPVGTTGSSLSSTTTGRPDLCLSFVRKISLRDHLGEKNSRWSKHDVRPQPQQVDADYAKIMKSFGPSETTEPTFVPTLLSQEFTDYEMHETEQPACEKKEQVEECQDRYLTQPKNWSVPPVMKIHGDDEGKPVCSESSVMTEKLAEVSSSIVHQMKVDAVDARSRQTQHEHDDGAEASPLGSFLSTGALGEVVFSFLFPQDREQMMAAARTGDAIEMRVWSARQDREQGVNSVAEFFLRPLAAHVAMVARDPTGVFMDATAATTDGPRPNAPSILLGGPPFGNRRAIVTADKLRLEQENERDRAEQLQRILPRYFARAGIPSGVVDNMHWKMASREAMPESLVPTNLRSMLAPTAAQGNHDGASPSPETSTEDDDVDVGDTKKSCGTMQDVVRPSSPLRGSIVLHDEIEDQPMRQISCCPSLVHRRSTAITRSSKISSKKRGQSSVILQEREKRASPSASTSSDNEDILMEECYECDCTKSGSKNHNSDRKVGRGKRNKVNLPNPAAVAPRTRSLSDVEERHRLALIVYQNWLKGKRKRWEEPRFNDRLKLISHVLPELLIKLEHGAQRLHYARDRERASTRPLTLSIFDISTAQASRILRQEHLAGREHTSQLVRQRSDRSTGATERRALQAGTSEHKSRKRSAHDIEASSAGGSSASHCQARPMSVSFATPSCAPAGRADQRHGTRGRKNAASTASNKCAKAAPARGTQHFKFSSALKTPSAPALAKVLVRSPTWEVAVFRSSFSPAFPTAKRCSNYMQHFGLSSVAHDVNNSSFLARGQYDCCSLNNETSSDFWQAPVSDLSGAREHERSRVSTTAWTSLGVLGISDINLNPRGPIRLSSPRFHRSHFVRLVDSHYHGPPKSGEKIVASDEAMVLYTLDMIEDPADPTARSARRSHFSWPFAGAKTDETAHDYPSWIPQVQTIEFKFSRRQGYRADITAEDEVTRQAFSRLQPTDLYVVFRRQTNRVKSSRNQKNDLALGRAC
ncbi:unnamed protein product [Amoebophrya sp. A25]|nr:unnamed protein product [Amoebophrya sp. A25]|eukprot:GSA25T00009816001.1